MIHFIRSMVSVFILALFVVVPSAQAVLNDYDRQEFAFKNGLAEKNPGLESGSAGWTCSPSLTVNSGTQIVPRSKQYGQWNSNGAAQNCYSTAVKIPQSGNCSVGVWYSIPSGTGTHLLVANDGTNDLATETITSSTLAQYQEVEFPCASSTTGNARLGIRSVAADEPSISWDDAYVGRATQVRDVNNMIAWTAYTPTVSAISGTLTNFTVQGYYREVGDTADYKIRLVFTGSPGTWSNPLFSLPTGHTVDDAKIPGGSVASFNVESFGTATDTGTATYKAAGRPYTTTQLIAQQLFVSGSAISLNSFSQASPFTWVSTDELEFVVEGVPLVGRSARTALDVADQGWFVAGEITGANPTLGTSAVTSYTEITNGSLTLTPFTGSASVGITCASGTASVVGGYTCGVNESLGITFNAPQSGFVEVCMAYTISGATGNTTTFQVSQTSASSSTIVTNGIQRTSFYDSSTTVAVGSTQRNCSPFPVTAGQNTFRLMYEMDAATNAPGIIADGNASLGQRNFSFVVKPINGQTQAILTNAVVSRDAVNGQVTTVNTVVSKSTTYTATANDETISASMSGGAWTLSLPAAAGLKGKKYHIVLPDDSANGLTIDPNSTETICGQSTIVMRGLRDSMTIQSDGTNWLGLDESCWRTNSARIDCDSGSTVPVDRQRLVSTIGNISGGTCSLTLNTGNYSGSPGIVVSWNGTGASSDFYGVCSSATSCALGGGGAVTTAQLEIIVRGPR